MGAYNPGSRGPGPATVNTPRVVLAEGSPGISPATAAFGAVTTANPGSTWTPLPSALARAVTLLNGTGADLEIRRGGTGETFVHPDGLAYTYQAITNADEIEVRRLDLSNTPVTARYELET